jgi:hypothetical protein
VAITSRGKDRIIIMNVIAENTGIMTIAGTSWKLLKKTQEHKP